MSDLDGNNAVVVASDGDGISGLWAFARDRAGRWTSSAFQTNGSDQFGWDVALAKGTIVVGAPGWEGRDIYHPTNTDFQMWGGRGAVFVITKEGGNWNGQNTKLLMPKSASSNAKFGISVDISGEPSY